MEKKSILYCYTSLSSFGRKDLDIISEAYTVRHAPSGHLSKTGILFKVIAHFFKVLRHIVQSDKVLVQGAGYHSFFPALLARIFGRPCYIIVIGNDASSFPSIGYGNFSKQPLSWVTAQSMRMATSLLPVHESLQSFEYRYAEEGAPHQGYETFIQGLKTPSKPVLNGYDPERWCRGEIKKVSNRFCTAVSRFNSPSIIPLKGLDLLFEAARSLPDYEFQIIGLLKEELGEGLPENIQFTGPVSHDEIRAYFAESSFYMQLSMSEGFPNAICEAMLCECVPIGSAVNAIPEIIGDAGQLVEHRNAAQVVSALKAAVSSYNGESGTKARQRIMGRYPRNKRAKELLAALN